MYHATAKFSGAFARVLIASAAVVAVVPASASAAKSSPAKWGVRSAISLTSKKTVDVNGGQAVAVRVTRSDRRGKRIVRVELAQKTTNGYRRVARASGTTGRLSVKVPTSGSRYFQLTIRVAGKRFRANLARKVVPGPAAPAPVPAPSPAPGSTFTPPARDESPCVTFAASPNGSPTADVTVDSPVVQAGDRVQMHIRNTTEGTRCLAGGPRTAWQQFVNDEWVAAPDGPDSEPVPDRGWVLAPGQAMTWDVLVPPHFAPGRYRLGAELSPVNGSAAPLPQLVAYGEVTVAS